MAMEIISRSQANLPPVPSSVGHRSMSSWTGIRIHHTGGAFSSWRGVHDWQTVGRPEDEQLVYIGYSFGVGDGQVTELRGWDRHPAHDHENSTLGVVVGGDFTSTLPSRADLDALVEFIYEVRRRTGRRLPGSAHRDTWPSGHWYYSTCPGDRFYRWIKQDLPDLLAGGGGVSTGSPPPGPVVEFPLPVGYYFGSADGPSESVSGHYGRIFNGRPDHEWLKAWVRQMRRRGWPAGPGERYLNRWGNDGRYGSEYRELIEAFQRDQGLVVDGLLGPATWDAAWLNPVT